MKKIMFACGVLFVLFISANGFASPVVIEPGETAIFAFDFTDYSDVVEFTNYTWSLSYEFLGDGAFRATRYDDAGLWQVSSLQYRDGLSMDPNPNTISDSNNFSTPRSSHMQYLSIYAWGEEWPFVPGPSAVAITDAWLRLSYTANGLNYYTEEIHGTPVSPVPEPATLLLLSAGLISLAGYGRKKIS